MSGADKREAARRLRRQQTTSEAALWMLLRDRQIDGLKFRRQQIIEGFIVDFFCAEHRIVVELDGGYHDEAEQVAADARRAAVLTSTGLRIVRLRNDEVTLEVVRRRVRSVTSPEPTT